jgi:hypothetical protein
MARGCCPRGCAISDTPRRADSVALARCHGACKRCAPRSPAPSSLRAASAAPAACGHPWPPSLWLSLRTRPRASLRASACVSAARSRTALLSGRTDRCANCAPAATHCVRFPRPRSRRSSALRIACAVCANGALGGQLHITPDYAPCRRCAAWSASSSSTQRAAHHRHGSLRRVICAMSTARSASLRSLSRNAPGVALLVCVPARLRGVLPCRRSRPCVLPRAHPCARRFVPLAALRAEVTAGFGQSSAARSSQCAAKRKNGRVAPPAKGSTPPKPVRLAVLHRLARHCAPCAWPTSSL